MKENPLKRLLKRCSWNIPQWMKKKPLKRLDRYIIVKFLGTYFFAIALIISCLLYTSDAADD